jgi:hypothetical protein
MPVSRIIRMASATPDGDSVFSEFMEYVDPSERKAGSAAQGMRLRDYINSH